MNVSSTKNKIHVNNAYSNKNSYYCNQQITCHAKKQNINLNNLPFTIPISFKGYFAEHNLKQEIIKFVNLVNDNSTKKIAFISHANPDCDAISSMIAGKYTIKDATGKNADVFIMNQLDENAAFLDTTTDKVKCINSYFNNSEPTNEDILEKFGNYDLVVVTDTPYKTLIDKKINDTILKYAKKVVKIDHHLYTENTEQKDFMFGDINIIDNTKESASQIMMQLVKPFGLDLKQINPKISDAIATGMLADGGQFTNVKNKKIFKDAAKLQETSNLSKISKEINSLNIQEFEIFADILKNIKFTDDKEIAYFVMPKEKTSMPIKNPVIAALTQLSKIRGVKYYFSIIEDPNESGKITSSLRSNEKPINYIANKFNGGGHSHASGFSTNTDSTENLINNIIYELNILKNS